MRYINELRDGEQVNGIYFCKVKNALKTKMGKSYYALTLQDKTGVVDAKIWELNNGIEHFEAMDYINVIGSVTMYQGSIQLNVTRVRKAGEGEYDMRDFMPTSERNMNEMAGELKGYISSVENTYLKTLLTKIFIDDKEFYKAFTVHSAAKSMHHGFVGGLMEHTLAVTKICDFLAKQYPMLNRDLLISGALLHDIGKVSELSAFPSNDYTDDGQLLGHIYMGTAKVNDAAKEIPGFPAKLLTEVSHCILSHHGKLEYGSPKKPSLAEAIAINFADDCDAKLEALKELFDSNPTMPAYSKMLDNVVRRTEGIK